MALSAEVVRTRFTYDCENGKLFWRTKPCARIEAGAEAGGWSKGYRVVRLNGRVWPIHHLIWLLETGSLPEDCIDHINMDRSDNRIGNLRQATRGMNTMNTGARATAKIKAKGVCFNKRLGKYVAQISKDKVVYHIGVYPRVDEASHAYNKAAIQLHGEFARLNPIGEP